jgi:N-glycosylase/DNA lyase
VAISSLEMLEGPTLFNTFRCESLNLTYTLECGQAFRWKRRNGWYYGVVRGHIIKIGQNGHDFTFFTAPVPDNYKLVAHYFALDEDYQAVVAALQQDPVLAPAVREYYGLRIVRQEPWECLISYIISANNRIPMIMKSIECLSQRYGTPVELHGYRGYSFPTAEALASLEPQELVDCGLGFRSGYVVQTARTVLDQGWDLESMAGLPYEEARARLMQLPGVGPKVADCVLLFSMGMGEAFPVDIWIKRAVEELYFGGQTLTIKKVQEFGRRFGKYAGYAQEFLYYYARMKRIGVQQETKRS